MSEVGEIEVKLKANHEEFTHGVESASESLEKLAKVAEALGVEKVLEKMAEAFEHFVEKASESEMATLRLQGALAGRGQKEFSEALEASAEQLSHTTAFEKDAAVGAEALAAKLGLSAQNIQALLPSMANYATFTGSTLPASADALSSAVERGGRSLKMLGLGFTDSERKAFDAADQYGRVAMLTDKIQGKMGGLSEAFAGTGAGAMEQFKNSIGEVEISFGKVLDAPIAGFFQGLTSAVNGFKEMFDALNPTIKSIIGEAAIGAGGLLGIGVAIIGISSAVAALKALELGSIFLEALSGAKGLLLAVLPIAAAMGAIGVAAIMIKGSIDYVKQGKGVESVDDVKGMFMAGFNDFKSGLADLTSGLFADKSKIEEHGKVVDSSTTHLAVMSEHLKAVAEIDFKGVAQYSESATTGLKKLENLLQDAQFDFSKHVDANGNELSGDALDAEKQSDANNQAGLSADSKQWDSGVQSLGTAKSGGMTQEQINAVAAERGKAERSSFGYNAMDVGGKALKGLGSAGSDITMIAQGAATGGPMGAVAGVVEALLARNASFQKVGQTLSGVLDTASTILTPIIDAIAPIIDIVRAFGNVVASLSPVMKLMNVPLHILALAVEQVAKGLLWVVEQFAKAYNWLIDLIDKIPGVNLSEYKVDTSKMDHAFDAPKEQTATATTHIQTLGAAAKTTSEHLTNSFNMATTSGWVETLNRIKNRSVDMGTSSNPTSMFSRQQQASYRTAYNAQSVSSQHQINITTSANPADVVKALENYYNSKSYTQTGFTNITRTRQFGM